MLTALLAGQLVWNLPMLWILLGIAGLYVWAIRRFAFSFAPCQPALFFLSLSLFYLTMGSPLTALSHLSFILHMVQMSVLYFIVPLLFLRGVPNELFHTLRNVSSLSAISRWIPKPKWSLVLFSVLLLVYHFPITLNALAHAPFARVIYASVLLLFSFGMWWPFAAPNSAPHLENHQKIRYAKWCGILVAPACAFFIFSAFFAGSSNPFLSQLTAELCGPFVDPSAIVPSPFHSKADQALAGLFMFGIHKCALIAACRIDGKKK